MNEIKITPAIELKSYRNKNSNHNQNGITLYCIKLLQNPSGIRMFLKLPLLNYETTSETNYL